MTELQPDEFDTSSGLDVDGDGATPAAPDSPLTGLRARREKAKKTLHLDLEVPRIDPPVFVRFKPVPQNLLNAANKRANSSTKVDKDVVANAGILVEACLGIYEVIDGEEVSVDENDRAGTWPKFDKDLARVLGVPTKGAVDTVRELYLTDGDIISTVNRLATWSGYAQEQLDRETPGN